MGRQPCNRPTADCSIRLDLSELVRRGGARLGVWVGSEMTWGNGLRVRIAADMTNAEAAVVLLQHMEGERYGEASQLIHYEIRLEPRHQHLGGVRWWFVCPVTGRLARVLVLPYGARRFASRYAFRKLSYACQRETPADRHIRRARKARRRLGMMSPDLSVPLPEQRPHRMRRATYERLLREACDADLLTWGDCSAWIDRLKSKHGLR